MGRTISVRLDDEAITALRKLEADGKSRSEAVRGALVDSALRSETLREQAARVAADPADRAEVASIQELMDELSEPW